MEMTTQDLVILANLKDRECVTDEQYQQAVEIYLAQVEGGKK